ncbi:MAG: rod shape-determining protein MreC [Pelagibacterales bacterium]|nr:rod shape-determining protein MreC [Pelagibacterales bacterium]
MAGLSDIKRVQSIIKEKTSNSKILTFISLIFVLMLIFSSYLYPTISHTVKMKILDYSGNIINSIYSPISTVNNSLSNISNIINTYNINNELIKENENLKIIENQIIVLQSENEELKKLLSISNDIKYKFITAKIISKSNLSFIRSSILMSGKKDNILLSSPVIYNNTLLGYINEVGFNSSRVLSLTDINVKAPAVILGKDVKVILAGNNSKYLDILNYLDISSLKSGDKVFTSGDGNMYPAGLYIGKVKTKLDGSFVVEPAENLNNLNYVQIINWKPEERGIDINIDPIFYE